MSNARVRKALEELRNYYGVNANNPYLALNRGAAGTQQENGLLSQNPTVLDSFATFVQPDENNIIKEFMERITTKSETSPGVRSILERSKELSGENGAAPIPMLVTPYIENDQTDSIETSPLVNTNIGKETRQGTLQPLNKKFYTFKDAAGLGDGNPSPKVSVIQIFSPVNSISATDTDIVALYMNSVTSLEASRAVPYIDLSIATAVGLEKDGETAPMSLGRFLGIKSRRDLTPGTADYALANGYPLMTRFVPDYAPAKDKEGNPTEETKIVSGIEMFTLPQTMVNAEDAYDSDIASGKVLDPFQPFMSLESMKVSVVGAGGLMSYRYGEISLILHDRARMDEIAALIAPSRFGKTRLIVTYGYSHPSGKQLTAPLPSEGYENAVGALIDNMKVTEVFQVTSISFSFTGQVVKLNLQISTVGSNDFNTIDIVYADMGDDIKYVKEQLDVINRGIAESNNSTLSKKIVSPVFLSSPNTIGGNGLTDEQLKALQELKKGNNNDSLNAIIEELFGKNGKGGKVADLVKNKNQKLESLFALLENTPDPFLPDISIRDVKTTSYIWNGRNQPAKTKSYVSLGKIISTFVGNSMMKSPSLFVKPDGGDEVQIFFHPFNQDAGGLQDYNISQFVVDLDDFKRIVKERFDITGSMSLKKFLEIMRQFFVADMGAIGYGLLDSAQRRKFKMNAETGKRATPEQKNANKSTPGKSGAPKQPVKAPEYEETLEKNKKENLRAIYQVGPSAPLMFRPPDLQFHVECVPKSVGWNDDPNKTSGNILKVHVLDRACSTMTTLGEILRSVGENGIVPLTSRPTHPPAFPYTTAHSVYGTKIINELIKDKMLKPLERSEIETVQNEKNLTDINKETIDDLFRNYLLFNAEPQRAKEVIKRVYPTLIYGSETSGLLSVNFSSENDSQLTSIMLTRTRPDDHAKPGDKDGVPIMVMPASLSVETLGCPYLSYAQFFYLDLGTNTNIDNVYAITSIDHSIEPGKFRTSAKLTHYESFGIFRPLPDEMAKTFLAAFLARFKVKKPDPPKKRIKGAAKADSPVSSSTNPSQLPLINYFSSYGRTDIQ